MPASSTVVALLIIAAAGYGLSRIPTGFLPIEDQGYLLATVQLPDGASLERTNNALQRAAEIARKTPGVESTLSIAGVSALDNNATLANSGVIYIILKDWDARGKDEQLLPLFTKLSREFDQIMEAKINVLPPPPIQGIGNAGGFTMMVQLRDGSFDFTKLQAITNQIVTNAQSQSGLQRVQTSFRADVPQLIVEVDRVKAQTLFVPVDAGVPDRSRAISARATSRSSTSSAAPSRSMCRRIRSSACSRATSTICRCATPRATWCRSARW